MKKHIFFLAAVVLVCISCDTAFLDKDYKDGDWMYLDNKGAIMPIWVRGNTASKTFIVFLHGGPGNTGMTYAASSAHEKLQNDYAFVYYDQRASGMSQGNPKAETFTIDQFVEDLDKIITLIKHQYDCQSIFLLGKSWGGCFGTAYLLDGKRQQKIKGWIEEDGAHNFKWGIALSREWVKGKAQEKIRRGDNAGYWQKEVSWYNGNPNLVETDNLLRHGKNVNDLNGIYYNPANDPGNAFSFASPVPVFYQMTTLHLTNNNKFDMKNSDYSPEMYKITIPSMILWGRHDGTLPVDLAQNAYDSLGTDPADKSVYIFEKSAHCASFEEPGLWVQQIKTFVEKYK